MNPICFIVASNLKTKASGDKYVGEFKDDMRHGQGTYTQANGTVTEGLWEEGDFIE